MKNKVGRIILSKVLSMSLEQYLKYIHDKTSKLKNTQHALRLLPYTYKKEMKKRTSKRLIYAKVLVKKNNLTFRVTNPLLMKNIHLDNHAILGNGIVALKWINTRNQLSKHILKSLLDYQKSFWLSGNEIDLKPLTLQEFLKMYPTQFLDKSRLSRLLPTLLVETPQGKVICLRRLLPSRKKCYSYRIQEIVNQHDVHLKDADIKKYLDYQGVHLSLRSICYYRKSLNIPNYKYRISHYYGKNAQFSDYIKLYKGQYNRIPTESGVYELSISKKIKYLKNYSEVVYIGASKNIRKRVLSYSNLKTKNARLKMIVHDSTLFVRYILSNDYKNLEKCLLRHFRITYGELPKGNKLGGKE
ncbi:hypothetical protein ABRY23_01645 [Melioribacteraceae bacterium 4301-Me]|uniref:RNA polymerase factor sigma-54 n=1 Tax=Pyranulibacter aquaticus TaxID=3163344 RepID=UPI00359B0D9A